MVNARGARQRSDVGPGTGFEAGLVRKWIIGDFEPFSPPRLERGVRDCRFAVSPPRFGHREVIADHTRCHGGIEDVGKAVAPLSLDKVTGAAESAATGAKDTLEKGAKDASDKLKKLLGDVSRTNSACCCRAPLR